MFTINLLFRSNTLSSHSTTQPLFYAASLGNTRLVHTLLEAHASVDTMCNLGDTAANVAYAHGHTAVADLLDGAGGAKPPRNASSLPPHPLLGGAGDVSDGRGGGATCTVESAHQ